VEAVRQLDLFQIPFQRAGLLAPPCGIVGIFGDAPVVLNCPSFSRLLGLSCANAAAEARSGAARHGQHHTLAHVEFFLLSF